MNETQIIDLIKTLSPANSSVLLGIDDDAAVLENPSTASLVCTDMLMEGTHFLLENASPAQIGHKALAVNLSDIAAMGGRALSAYVSLALPETLKQESFIRPFYEGLGRLALRYGVALAGGDTNCWRGPLVVNVTVVGAAHARGPVLRSGAQAGDQLFVTGPLGGSINGHHLSFMPRLTESARLMEHYPPSAMMDISDGLAKDLRVLTGQSGLAAFIDPTAVPIRSEILSDPHALERAFCDGEDFELCFALAPEAAAALRADPKFSFCHWIGELRVGEGLHWTRAPAGLETRSDLKINWRGYEHGADA